MSDPVDHPSHYTQHPSGIECIQITEHPLNYIEWHRPQLYRYRVAHQVAGFRIGFNRYPGVKIGAYVVIGHYFYCVKWGWARVIGRGGNHA